MLTDYVKNWFARAGEDMELIQAISRETSVSPNVICFHAQQAGEKYLKGFLAHHDLHVRKVHDLEVLVEDCKSVDKTFEELRDEARLLNNFYIESRYPDNYMEFSIQNAKDGFESAKRIKEFVLSKIK